MQGSTRKEELGVVYVASSYEKNLLNKVKEPAKGSQSAD